MAEAERPQTALEKLYQKGKNIKKPQPFADGVEPDVSLTQKEADVDQNTQNKIVGKIVETTDKAFSDTSSQEETMDSEEKQRVLDVLQAFYQEQAHQTIDHKVLQGLIEDKKKILQEVLEKNIYISVFPNEKDTHHKLIEMQFDNNYDEKVIGNTDEQGENQAYSNDIFIKYLNQEITNESDPQEKTRLKNFLNKFSKNEESLHEYVKKINEKRIAIGKDILTLSEFSEWEDKDVEIFEYGVYSLDGYSHIDINKDDQIQSLSFTLYNGEFLDLLSQVKDRFGISDDELAQVLKSQSIDTAEVQALLDEIRETSSAPEPAEAQPSEDPYALRGGKEEYERLMADYRRLKELEEHIKKGGNWFGIPKDRKTLTEWDDLRIDISFREFLSLSTLAKADFHDQTDRSYSGFKTFFDQEKELKKMIIGDMKRLLDGKPLKKNKDYIRSQAIAKGAVLLKKHNFDALSNIHSLESVLPVQANIIMDIMRKEKDSFDISKLYLNFNDEPKPAVATPATGLDELKQAINESISKPKIPPPLSQPESEEELKKRKLGAITELIEKRFDSLYDDLKVDMPDLDADDLESEHTIHLKQYALKFARRIELEIDDELNKHIVDNINSTKENKQKTNN